MSDLAKEIREELREEKIFHFLKENARYFVLFCILLVAFSSIAIWYKSYSTNKIYQDGGEYLAAIMKIQAHSLDEGIKRFENIKDNSSNYGALANINLAAYAIYNKQYAKASSLLEEVADGASYDKVLRQFAGLYRIIVDLESGAIDKEDTIKNLEIYLKSDSAYSPQARELLIVLYIDAKETTSAKEQIALVLNQPNMPETLLNRVRQYSSLLASN